MALLKQSTTYTRMFLMVDSTDHIAGKTGLSPTVNLSKAGGSFAAAGGTISEVSNGWYKIVLTTTDTNTLGDLGFRCTATGADPTDFVDQVIALDLADATRGGMTALPNANAGANGGLPTGNASGQVTVGTNNDKTGYALSTAGVQAIWDTLTSALTTVNSIGKLLVNNVDTTISSRLATAGYSSPPAAATIADSVWDEARADHTAAGSFGQGAASVQGDVTGSVGSVTGAVGSVTSGVTVTTNNDKTGYGLSSAAVQAIWDAATSALTAVGSIGKRLADNIDATTSSRLATAGYTTPPTVVAIRSEMDTNSTKLANLDATVTSRASQTSLDTLDDYVDTEVAAIKAKTDQLNFTGTDVKATLDGETVGLSASQGGTTFTSLTVTGNLAVQDGVTVTASTTNRAGIETTGNGTGPGLKATGGDGVTGAAGIRASGGANSSAGHGLHVSGGGASTAGILAAGAATGAGHGIMASAGAASGSGIYGQGGLTGGDGMTLSRTHSSGDDLRFANSDAVIPALGTQAKADVNAEVVDALNVDTYAEPSAAPAATASLVTKLGWLFALARNKRTTTSSTETLRNDADSGDIATAAVSDDGSTFSRAKWS